MAAESTLVPEPPPALLRRLVAPGLRKRIWSLFDDPTSSTAASIIAGIVIAMITLSTTAFIVQTLPQFVFSPNPAWDAIEKGTIAGAFHPSIHACLCHCLALCMYLPPRSNPRTRPLILSVFTTEFMLRICCCPSLRAFVTSPMNIIDFLAIAPFYAELIYSGSPSGSSSAILRILRLIRIFRVFKVSRYLPWVRVFASALTSSLQPLLMLVFVILIAMVVFSSAIYFAERGEWDPTTNLFMRDPGDGTPPVPSPYQSIPDSMWWCIVTMTTGEAWGVHVCGDRGGVQYIDPIVATPRAATAPSTRAVGYGDMVPLTPLGRFIASLAALSGILVLAIPITVISTNFNSEYDKLQKERAAVRARVLLLKTHFRERRTGLDAVLDEVDDLVRRNTQELADEVTALFEAARADLTAEVQEIVRMAYERRRLLHLAAMTAGHVSGAAQLRFGRAGEAAALYQRLQPQPPASAGEPSTEPGAGAEAPPLSSGGSAAGAPALRPGSTKAGGPVSAQVDVTDGRGVEGAQLIDSDARPRPVTTAVPRGGGGGGGIHATATTGPGVTDRTAVAAGAGVGMDGVVRGDVAALPVFAPAHGGGIGRRRDDGRDDDDDTGALL